MNNSFNQPNYRLSSTLPDFIQSPISDYDPVIGVLHGEGCGPEVINVALDILKRINAFLPNKIQIRIGGEIGLPAMRSKGKVLTDETIDFCQSIFDRHGAVLCGPAGGRFVYELRAIFDLYCKFTPIKPMAVLNDTGIIKKPGRSCVDLVVVRENTGGLYFGEWGYSATGKETSAFHRFEYQQKQVERILSVAFRLANLRRKRLTVVLKPGGTPTISDLWQQSVDRIGRSSAVEAQVLEVDNAMYQLIANAGEFDVVVAPNMFGDVLSDGASLLLGSRGLSFSGNFGPAGVSIFQTGHGAAHDLANTGRVNPIGQIFSLAMLLRETFGLYEYAAAIETAVENTLGQKYRTPDIKCEGCTLIGTSEMGERIGENLEKLLLNLAA